MSLGQPTTVLLRTPDRRARLVTSHLVPFSTGTVCVCAVRPTSNEIAELDDIAQGMGVALTVCPVKYSENNLLAFYDPCSVEYLATSFVSLGMDAMRNALRLTLRDVDTEALAFFKERVPADALWVEIAPRAPRAFAASD